VTALTGIDAISHALETYVTTRRNPMSLIFSREAWRLLQPNYLRVLEAPQDLQARAAMQLGASLAGLAIENSMLGAVHALANPLTRYYDVPHGQAIALVLPQVVRFNSSVVDEAYGELRRLTPEAQIEDRDEAPHGELLARLLLRLIQGAGLQTRLSDVGVERDRLGELAADAAKQWTGTFNPRPVDEKALLRLYEAVY
jgi:alcohol dehydrogenase